MEEKKDNPASVETLPEDPPASPGTSTDSAAAAKTSDAPADSPEPKPRKPLLPAFAGKARTCWRVVKETWDEHDIWVNALAIKGGVSAIVIAGVACLSYAVALPLLATAAVIAAAGAVLGVSIYSCAAAGMKGWDSLRTAYARAMGRPLPEKKKREGKDILQRFNDNVLMKKAKENPWAKKFLNSRAWKMTQKLTKRHEDNLLHGMAVGGALLSIALGVTVLATQILVLPVIAVSTLFTLAAVEVVTCFASGIYGLYLSGQSILKKHREKKEARRAANDGSLHLELDEPAPAPESPKEIAPLLTPVFTEKADAGNDNAPKKPEPDAIAVPAAKKAGPAAP